MKNQEMNSYGKKSWGCLPVYVLFIAAAVMFTVPFVQNLSAPNLIKKTENILVGEMGEVETVTKTSLEETVRISRLYTAEYPYNGYTAVFDEDTGEIKYYVAYEGTVKAGIDVSKIRVSLEEGIGTIIILLPEIEVTSPMVDAGTMEYIFTDEKYNTETVAQEAYKAANDDLSVKAGKDVNIITTAREAAKTAAKALVEPWINQVGGENEYTVKVLAYVEKDQGDETRDNGDQFQK